MHVSILRRGDLCEQKKDDLCSDQIVLEDQGLSNISVEVFQEISII